MGNHTPWTHRATDGITSLQNEASAPLGLSAHEIWPAVSRDLITIQYHDSGTQPDAQTIYNNQPITTRLYDTQSLQMHTNPKAISTFLQKSPGSANTHLASHT